MLEFLRKILLTIGTLLGMALLGMLAGVVGVVIKTIFNYYWG